MQAVCLHWPSANSIWDHVTGFKTMTVSLKHQSGPCNVVLLIQETYVSLAFPWYISNSTIFPGFPDSPWTLCMLLFKGSDTTICKVGLFAASRQFYTNSMVALPGDNNGSYRFNKNCIRIILLRVHQHNYGSSYFFNETFMTIKYY